MILADKIIMERKKNGWSQEEMADKLGVTRQAVSKWESAQATPDLQRLLEMSRLFGVTVDYLLKEEMETEEYLADVSENGEETYKVSMEMATTFLSIKKEAAPKIAMATALCILSPVTLLLLLGSLECGILAVSENIVVGIGLMALLGIIAIACTIFISCGMKTKEFEFLERECFETEYGVTGMVKERKRKYENTYSRYNIYGTVLCIMGAMALFSALFFEEYEFMGIFIMCLVLVLVAIGVRFFVIAGINQSSFEKLLQEGDYTVKKKVQAKKSVVAAVSTIYWLVVTAIFFLLSFSSKHWNTCGLIWPIAGVLFPAVIALVKLLEKKE